jgi:hypothetical protein
MSRTRLSRWHATCFPVFQREQKPGLRFHLAVKLLSKHKENLMNRKLTLSLVLTTLATLIVTASVMLGASSAQAATPHNNNKVVKTSINLRTATQIGNTTLSPGKYRVKIIPASDRSGDPTVQFSILYNPYGDDFNPPYEEVVVLTVQASMVDLRAPAASTELIPTSGDDNKASALEIRGNSKEYVFGAKTASAANE